MYILLVAPIAFLIVTLVLERATPNYNWRTDFISELSLGKYGWIQKLNFIITGILIIGLCLLLAAKTNIFLVKLGWYLGLLIGVFTALEGILDTDVKIENRTTAGVIHERIFNLGLSATGLAYVIIGLGYIDKPIVAIFSWTIALLNYFIWNYSGNFGVSDGIRQRMIVFSALMWVQVLATWSLLFA